MSDQRTPGEDQIRNDYLAGRGAAPDAKLDDFVRSMVGAAGQQMPSGGAAAASELKPEDVQTAGISAPQDLPIGKRILSAAGSFLYGLAKPFVEGPSFTEQVQQHEERVAQMVQQKQEELGRPLTAVEASRLRLSIPPQETPAFGLGLGFAGGAIGKGAVESRVADLSALAGEPKLGMPIPEAAPATLGEKLQEHLSRAAPSPSPAQPQGAEGTAKAPDVTRETSARPQRSVFDLGDPSAPAVEIKPTAQTAAQAEVTLGRMATEGEPHAAGFPEERATLDEQTIHDYLAGARVDNPVKVNLARIGSGEDIADVLAQVSKTIPEQAVQSNEATIHAADALGLSPEDFLRGYQGKSLSAAETTAMRFTLDSSAQQLINFAKAAREPLAPPEAQAQFLKAFTVHRSLQQYFENARAEAGRTLQSWQIMSQTRASATQAIGDLLKSTNQNGDLSTMIDNIADMDNPLHVNKLAAESMRGSGRDTLMKVMYNIRLSSPTTIVKKLTSDVGMAMMNVATRGIAEKFGSAGEVAPGETWALLHGYMKALPDAIRAGGKALKAGESQFWRDYHTMDTMDLSQGYGGGAPDQVAARVQQRFRLSALANGVPEPLEIEQPTKGMMGFIQSALPTSWIAGADDFAKVWQYRANLRALAYRESGGDTTEFTKILDNVPQWMHQQAANDALKYTFQEPLTGLAASIRDGADRLNVRVPGTQFDIPWGRMIMPFLKVPVNISRMAYRTSPLPLVLRSPAMRQILSNPGAERDIAIAQMGLGTTFVLGTMGAAMGGYFTGRGPSNPALNREWRAAGNQPYSLQLPGARPVGLNQIEPFGQVMSTAADTLNLMKFAKDTPDAEKLASSLAFGVGQALLSKTYFQNFAELLSAIEHPDEEGPGFVDRYIAGLVPQGVQRIAEATDNWRRAHYHLMDSIEANLPEVRKGLPPAQTLWGDPVPAREAFAPFIPGKAAEVFSPLPMGPRPEDTEPIDKWLWENRDAFPHEAETQRGISAPGKTVTYSAGHGVDARFDLTPEELYRYRELAGNALKDPQTGMGAKDTLNAFVEGDHPSASQQDLWDRSSPSAKALIVRSVIDKFRRGAKEQLVREFPEVAAAIQAGIASSADRMRGATVH